MFHVEHCTCFCTLCFTWNIVHIIVLYVSRETLFIISLFYVSRET